ncbi:MAG: type II secretion system F family protein [Planctomycetota bacterium]
MNELFASLFAGAAAGLLAVVAAQAIREGFRRYEEKYAAAGKANLDALYLSLDARLLSILSFSAGSLLGFLGYALGGGAVGVMGLATGLFAPLFILSLLKKKRLRAFNEQLVEALGQMSNSLRAGFTMPQAIDLIAREMDNPLAMEFKIARADMRLGMPPVQALRQMTSRVPLADLDLLVTSIDIAEGIGGNLTKVFDSLGVTIRERFRVEGRIESLSAMGRMQGLVLILMPFALVLILKKLQPEYIRPLFEHPVGQVCCAAGLVWLALGWLSIRRIVSIDV